MNPFGPGSPSGNPQQPGPHAGSQFGGPAPNPFAAGAPSNPPSPAPFGDPHGRRTSTDNSLDPVGPPTGILAAAAVLAVIGIVVGSVFWATPIAVVGWLAAGPLAIGVLAAFTSRDTSRRAAAVYLRPDWITAGYAVVIVLITAGVVVGSIGFAMWIGHR